ncbi:carbohydrate kinase [Desulfovibrio sp.]|uniref:carbohydrate kinase family protein n=1 Tax=Desulfovibrio sp. TaxID=885 RepID=UPI0023C830AB|nr:carbohydrate kinase [Desulfovibrio sp.]MDE7242312.1 carbohydrate kinase [Desulfovibrio sp.]
MQMNNGDIVVGLGEALWDILPDGKKLGGAPANFAYHCARCGLDSWAVSAIGDDRLGEEIAEQLSEKQVNYIMEVVPYPTGTVQVELSPAGVPTYEIKSGVAWDNLPFTPRIEELAKKTRAVSFGSLAQRSVVTRDSIDAFLDAMPQDNDRFIVFDVNLRQNFYTPECLESSMERCNILKINDEELIAVSRMFGYPGIDLKDKCWLLLGRHNLKVLVLTCGVNGSYVFTPGHVSFLPTPNVEVADTIGAGDSFSAVFVSSLLKGCSVKQAHHNAVYYSAFVCTQHGAMPEYPESLKAQVSVLP